MEALTTSPFWLNLFMWHILFVLVFNTAIALLAKFILRKLGLWGEETKADVEKERKLKEEIKRYREHQARQQEILKAAKQDLAKQP